MRRRRFVIGGAALLLRACGGLTADRADRAERRRREAEARYPAPNRNAVIYGARVSTDQRGSGPDVVLIHGASGSSRDFTFALSDLIAREVFQEHSFGHREANKKLSSALPRNFRPNWRASATPTCMALHILQRIARCFHRV